MSRSRVLVPVLLLAAAVWLVAAAPVHACTTDGARAVQRVTHPRTAQVTAHATAPTADAVMAYDDADGDASSLRSVRPSDAAPGLRLRRTDLLSPGGADPAGTNRASRQALSSHRSTAPPVRI